MQKICVAVYTCTSADLYHQIIVINHDIALFGIDGNMLLSKLNCLITISSHSRLRQPLLPPIFSGRLGSTPYPSTSHLPEETGLMYTNWYLP